MARSRSGCFGSLVRLAGVLVLCGVLLLVFTAVFQPWGFYLGGTFHLIPYWQGWGTIRSKTGGEYVLFVNMRSGSPTRLGSAYLSGVGYICTPKHERFQNPTRRPSIDFRGRWSGNSLVMTDVGSIYREFLPDGSVNRGQLPAARDTLPITMTAGTMSQFQAACRAVR